MRFLQTAILVTIILALHGCNMVVPAVQARKLNDIGLKYSEQGDKAHAIQYFLEASKVGGITDSERTIYLQNTGEEYFESNPDSAKYYYQKAADINNRNSYNGLYSKANVYVLDGKIDKALRLLLRAYDIDKTKMDANNLIGLIYLGQYDDSFFDAETALKYNIASYKLYHDVHSTSVLARNYYEVDDMQKAIPLFEDVCRRAPSYTPYMATLAMVCLEEGRKAEADSVLNKLKELDVVRYNKVIDSHIKTGQHTLTWRVEKSG